MLFSVASELPFVDSVLFDSGFGTALIQCSDIAVVYEIQATPSLNNVLVSISADFRRRFDIASGVFAASVLRSKLYEF